MLARQLWPVATIITILAACALGGPGILGDDQLDRLVGADPLPPCNTNGTQANNCQNDGTGQCQAFVRKCKVANPGVPQSLLCDQNNGGIACSFTHCEPNQFNDRTISDCDPN